MNILRVENRPYNLDTMPAEIDDIRYCVLDYSNIKCVDHFFNPLVFLESFHAPAAVLSIGNQIVKMPLDWSILVCDEEFNELEVMPLTSIGERGFQAFLYNPFDGKTPTCKEVNIVNIFAEVKWFAPKMKNSTMLLSPIEEKKEPLCAYFVKDPNKTLRLDISNFIA